MQFVSDEFVSHDPTQTPLPEAAVSETMTRDEAIKTIKELSDAYKSQGAMLAKNAEAVADLTATVKALQEQHNRDQYTVREIGSDVGITRYINPEREKAADAVLWTGTTLRDGSYTPGLLDDDEVHGEWHAEIRRKVGLRNWVRMHSKRGVSPGMDRELAITMAKAPASIRKLFADSANVGAEWIPDQHVPQLEMDLRMARRTESLFRTMPMSDKEVRIPYLTTGLRPYIKGTPTSDDPAQYTSSSLATDKISLTATGFAVRSQIDEDAGEDSIIAWEPLMRAELVAAITDGINDAILNGDTAASHQDTIATWNPRSRWGSSGLGGSADHRKAWVGLRARAFDVSNTTDQSTAKTYAGYLTARATLASPHGVSGSLVIITSPEYYLSAMLGFSEVMTLEKFGPQATILSGQIASLGGAPVIVDEFMTADLAASGLYTGSGSKTAFLVFNRDRFVMGVRRGLSVEFDKDITRGVVNSVATVRKLFFTVDTSTKKNVHYSFNL